MLGKRGQALSVIAFFAVIIAIFIVSLVVNNMVNKVLDPFQSQITNISTEAGANVGTIKNGFNTWWDYAIVLLFILNVLLLFISAFMVDVHPAFLLIYILALAFLFIFGISVMGAVQNIWSTEAGYPFSESVAKMPITNWLMNNFSLVLLGIAILSGVIMYAKIKFGGVNA